MAALLLLPATLGAQTAPADLSAVEAESISTAPVMLDGKTLFRVRGVSSYPAQERAGAIAGRINAVAGDRALSPGDLRAVDAGDRSNLLAGDLLLMSVFENDARIEGVDRHLLAQLYLKRVTEAVQAYRHDRSPRVLLVSTGYVLVATVVLIVALLGVRWLFRRAAAMVEQHYKARLRSVKIQSFEIVRVEQLMAGLGRLLLTVRALMVLVLLYFYLQFVLSLYPWTRPFAQELFAMVLRPLTAMGAGLLEAVPDLIFLAILVVVVRYLLRMARLFLEGVERGTVTIDNFDAAWAVPTYKIVRLLVIAFAVVVAYPYIPGSDSAAFKGVSIFLGVVFSLGSSSVVANFVAGYTLIYRRAFKVGDRIRIDDHLGDVLQMRAQVTHLRSLKNEEIIIPNSTILNSNVINYSSLARERGIILHTTVGIGYETPWRQVEAMLLRAAGRTEGLLTEPAPFIWQKALGDFSVTYELNVYCNQPQEMMALYTALHRNILDEFNEQGVQIMTPAYEGDPDQPKIVPKERWFSPPAQPSGSP
jgi:small-conductance mechanosensitive channel